MGTYSYRVNGSNTCISNCPWGAPYIQFQKYICYDDCPSGYPYTRYIKRSRPYVCNSTCPRDAWYHKKN